MIERGRKIILKIRQKSLQNKFEKIAVAEEKFISKINEKNIIIDEDINLYKMLYEECDNRYAEDMLKRKICGEDEEVWRCLMEFKLLYKKVINSLTKNMRAELKEIIWSV